MKFIYVADLFFFKRGILLSLLANIWGLVTFASVIWVIYDVLTQNRSMNDIMKIMWIVVALIFGILGAIFYYFIGKRRF